MNIFMVLTTIVSLIILSASATTTNIRKCQSAKKPADEDITITKCDKTPCTLKRGNDYMMEFKFTPEKDTKVLKNTVFARLLGLPVPFIGVDNTDACANIYDGKDEKAACPLKAGEQYVFKHKISVLPIYPTITTDVHWALTGDGNRDLFCIEIPAKIVA